MKWDYTFKVAWVHFDSESSEPKNLVVKFVLNESHIDRKLSKLTAYRKLIVPIVVALSQLWNHELNEFILIMNHVNSPQLINLWSRVCLANWASSVLVVHFVLNVPCAFIWLANQANSSCMVHSCIIVMSKSFCYSKPER